MRPRTQGCARCTEMLILVSAFSVGMGAALPFVGKFIKLGHPPWLVIPLGLLGALSVPAAPILWAQLADWLENRRDRKEKETKP